MVTGSPLLKRTEFREKSGVILALSWISQFGFHTGPNIRPAVAKGPWTLCSLRKRHAQLASHPKSLNHPFSIKRWTLCCILYIYCFKKRKIANLLHPKLSSRWVCLYLMILSLKQLMQRSSLLAHVNTGLIITFIPLGTLSMPFPLLKCSQAWLCSYGIDASCNWIFGLFQEITKSQMDWKYVVLVHQDQPSLSNLWANKTAVS